MQAKPIPVLHPVAHYSECKLNTFMTGALTSNTVCQSLQFVLPFQTLSKVLLDLRFDELKIYPVTICEGSKGNLFNRLTAVKSFGQHYITRKLSNEAARTKVALTSTGQQR